MNCANHDGHEKTEVCATWMMIFGYQTVWQRKANPPRETPREGEPKWVTIRRPSGRSIQEIRR